MSIETTPSGAPDPEWEGLVADFVNSPDTAPAMKQPAAVDLMGDAPLVPAWAKTRAGWKSRANLGRINTVRGFRKWLRRQGTRHGHPAQVYRGAARITVWGRGIEGAEVSKAKHEARRAHKEYRQAQWTNGKRLMPGSAKEKLSREMDRASEESERAMNKYRKARKDARTLQTLRAAAAVTPIAAIEGAGLVAGGSPGGLLATGLTLAGLALIGRRTNTGELWSDRDAKIGDGDRMTETMLNRVYQDAKVIGSDDVLKLITPCTLTADGQAWQVVFNLPSGIPAKKALGARDGIANGFGVSAQQIHQVRGDREDRIHLRVSLKLPFSTKPGKGPLLEIERVNLWRPIWMGVNLRSEEVLTSWVERSGLFGGEPGSGKSAAANDLLLAAALDPTVRMYLADGKAGADITPFEPIATMYDTDGDPERLLEILEHIWTVEIPQRRALAKEHGSRKLTEAMAAVDPRVCQAVLLVDEWSSYGAAADRKTREEMERLLRLVVQQGRALAFITLAATQKPDSDSVPTGIRDILSIRWAMRCLTPQASDTILGQGYASAGHSAQDILKSQRGVGIYMDGEGAEPELVRGHYYDDDEVALLLDRAYALRSEAGTLPVGPIEQLRGADGDGAILADLVALYADGGLLPAARVLEGLAAVGHTVTADRLAVLVPRTDEERKRQEIDGSKVSVYPLAAVRRAIAGRYGIAV